VPRLDVVWREEQVAKLRGIIATLSLEQRLELTQLFVDNQISTKVRSITDEQIPIALGLAAVYQLDERTPQ
jgi:hypothetical protein